MFEEYYEDYYDDRDAELEAEFWEGESAAAAADADAWNEEAEAAMYNEWICASCGEKVLEKDLDRGCPKCGGEIFIFKRE